MASSIAATLSAIGGPTEREAIDALLQSPAYGGSDCCASLIVALGPQLAGTDEALRGTATRLLAEVLHRLGDANNNANNNANARLPSGERLDHIIRFFTDRLGDYLTIGAVLHGLSALIRIELPAEAVLQIATVLLEQCDVRSVAQSQRHAAMDLALGLVRFHWPALAPSGTRLLLSAVRALDGEKDPRNLLQYFRLLRQLCMRCSEDGLAGFGETLEEVFESLSCYFPISFTPPPNDPYQINAQHLLQSLLWTLRSSSKFAPYALRFLSEKLGEVTSGAG